MAIVFSLNERGGQSEQKLLSVDDGSRRLLSNAFKLVRVIGWQTKWQFTSQQLCIPRPRCLDECII